MRITLSLFFLITALVQISAQDLSPFRIYDQSGKELSYKKLMKSIDDADVLLFGEYHNNSIVHWLQLELYERISAKRPVILGMEMLESDGQQWVDAYVKNEIDQKELSTRIQLWKNWSTDYAPLVDTAKTKNSPVIATNAPTFLSRMVYNQGLSALDGLIEEQLSLLAPTPIPFVDSLPGYARMKDMAGHGPEALYFPQAQAIKDATMAYRIADAHQAGSLFYHINGTYHSDDFEGIGWYLNHYRPDLRVMTISMVYQDDIEELTEEHKGKGNVVLVIPNNMIRTY